MTELAPVMGPERWLRIQDLFSAALGCEPAQRAALFDQQCGDDPDLRRDVESLLQSHDCGGPMDRLAESNAAPRLFRARVAAMDWQGRRVAQYRVLDALGAGAMGFVYKARDERLGRRVALKFLPPQLCAQADAKQRFLLEARAAAALDHPNICTIHEIGSSDDGQPFIAMALYDGETLQARLTRGPLALEEAVAIGQQIASALANAHEHGVVHRDVKPSNIMLLADAAVKILDFGVASVGDRSAEPQDQVAVGTAAYMSPEQTRGELVDSRTDVWSLGVMLYEMLVGARPFPGDSPQALARSVLTDEPAPASVARPDIPDAMDAIIRKALSKETAQRYRSMADMCADLASLQSASIQPHSGDVSLSSSGERRRVAVLVSVLPDYAALIEQLTPQELESCVGRIRAVAVEVARRHGGIVNHAFGEEIVCLFGVPAGHEDDDLRAVRAAMELHARVAQMSSSLRNDPAPRFRLQSGVHAGLLLARSIKDGVRRYSVTGPPVQVAARLASLAPQGGVLVSPECQRLVAPFVHAVPHESFVLYAGGEPTTPYRVIGESGLQTRLEAAAREGLTPYSGRLVELATLESLFTKACAGHGQLVFVTGDAGVGKSRLLYELRERIGASGARILQARCRSYGGVAPYLPFVEILRAVLDLQMPQVGAEEVAARIRKLDASLEAFVPLCLHLLSISSDAYPLPRQFRGDHLQAAVPEALVAILTLLVRDNPTVCLLEDWHWSDTGSRETLSRVMEVIANHALLVVVSSRPSPGIAADSDFGGARLQLGPLDFDSSVAIMQGVLHVRRVSDQLARRVFERTGGNPFFLEEVCQALLEQGSVASRDGEGVAAGGVETLRLPDTVQAVIRTRLDSLDPDALEVVRVASVIGREFGHGLLLEVMGSEPTRVRAIERLQAAGLIQQASVVPERSYRFKHILTQEVTYESLLGHQRRALHNLIGCAIERADSARIDEQAELLAYHFSRAEAWTLAVRYGRQAADRARALSQFADALAALDRVRDWVMHLPESEARVDLLADILLQQERQCETLGQRGRQEQIIAELISLLAPRGASERLAQAYQRQGDLSTLLKQFDAADRALSTAIRISRERADTTLERHALRSLGLLRWHEERHAEALAITMSALAIDRECNDEVAVAGDLANVGVILKSMGEYPRALASFEEALALPALAQDPPTLVYCLQNVANVHRVLGNLDVALELLQRANEISRIHLLSIQRSFHLMGIAHLFLQQERIEESLRTYEEAVALSRRAHHADGLVQSLRALGEVLFGLGRYTEALPFVREAATLFAQLADRNGEVEMSTRLATLLERVPDAGDASAVWEQVRELRVRVGDAHGELEALEGIARAARQQATSPSHAIAQVEAALALASKLRETSHEASLCNTLGILEWESGRYANALRHYERGLALARSLGDRVREGLALNSLGVTLARLNRHEEARTALEESVQLNRDTGEQLLEAQALVALGDVCRTGRRFQAARQCFEQSLALRRVLGDRTAEERVLQRLQDLSMSS